MFPGAQDIFDTMGAHVNPFGFLVRWSTASNMGRPARLLEDLQRISFSLQTSTNGLSQTQARIIFAALHTGGAIEPAKSILRDLHCTFFRQIFNAHLDICFGWESRGTFVCDAGAPFFVLTLILTNIHIRMIICTRTTKEGAREQRNEVSDAAVHEVLEVGVHKAKLSQLLPAIGGARGLFNAADVKIWLQQAGVDTRMSVLDFANSEFDFMSNFLDQFDAIGMGDGDELFV